MEDYEVFDAELPTDGRTGLSQLQSRYVIPFAVGVFAAIFIVGMVLTYCSRAMLVDQLKKEQLAASRAGAQALSNAMDNVATMVQSLAKSQAAKSQDFASAKIYFNSAISYMPAAQSILLFTSNSQILFSTNTSGDIVRSLLRDPCFDKVRAGASICYTGMYQTEDGGKRAYAFAPVFNNSGAATRIIAAGMDLEDKSIQSIVQGLNPGKKGFSYLVDSNGKLVLNGDPDKENSARDVSGYAVVREALSGKMGSLNYDYGRVRMLATFYPVDPMGWGLIAQRPQGEAGAGTGSLYKMLALFLALGTGAAAALAIVQAQGITRFLYLLSNRMDSVAGGKRGQSIASEEAGGLDQLALSFNRMASMIEQGWADGTRELEDVKKTARFNAGLLSSIQDLFIVTDPRLKVVLINEKAEVYVPANVRPAMGRFMSDLGHAWGQKRLQEAAQRAISNNEVLSLSNIRFTTPDRADTAVFDFRIYPVSSTGGVFFYGREVSEFMANHERVQNSERFFREISTGLGDPLVVIDSDHKVEWINPAASRLLQVEDDFLGENWMSHVAEKYRGVMLGLLANAPDDDTPHLPEELEIERGDGKLHIEVSVGKLPLSNSAVKYALTFRSVPSCRFLEREALQIKPRLENKIKFLTAAMESVPDVLAVVGHDGGLMMVNSAFADFFKEKKEVFIGKKLDAFHAAPGPMIDLASVARDGFSKRETIVRNLRGETFKAHVVSSVIQNGSNYGYVVTVREIETEERTRLYEKRMLESRTRTRLARSISGKMEAISDNLARTLQELGTNIFAENTRVVWAKAMKHCKELALTANSLHMYAVDTSVKLIACNVDEIVDGAVEELGRRGLVPENVNVEISTKGCPPVNADPDHLMMILWHIVKNAAEAAAGNPEGGEILVRAYGADIDDTPAVVIEVLDNGPDFDTEDIDHFFEPFYGTRDSGVGLGLTLSRRAVIKHNGRIGIQRSGNATRASFYIPLNLTPRSVSKTPVAAR